MSNPQPNPTLKAIIVDGDMKLLVEQAEKIGNSLARDLTTSQIRGIFGTVRRIEMDWLNEFNASQRSDATDSPAPMVRNARRELALLLPRIAYQARRERGMGVRNLSSELTPAIRLVMEAQNPQEEYGRFRNFVDFFEAILAYHRAFGGN